MGTMATTAKGMEVTEDTTTLVTTTTMDMVTIAVSTESLTQSPNLLLVGKLLLQIEKTYGLKHTGLGSQLPQQSSPYVCSPWFQTKDPLSPLSQLRCAKRAWTLVV